MSDWETLLRFCTTDEQKRVLRCLSENSDKSYREVGNLLGLTMEGVRSSVKRVRKNATGAGWNPSEPIEEDVSIIAHMEQRILKLQQQNRELRTEAADTTEIKNIISGFQKLEGKAPEWVVETPEKGGSTGTPTIFISDIHWSERVFPEQVQGTNQYDVEIARHRLRSVIDKSEYLLLERVNRPKYEGIVLQLGGDLISGNIHEEIRASNELFITEQIFSLFLELCACIDRLEQSFGKVFVPCVTGNHSRFDRKPRMKGAAQDNFEWLLYHFLQHQYARNKNVTFLIADGIDVQYKVHGHTYLLTHGDRAFRGGTGITGPLLPWMRGSQKKQRVYEAIDKPFNTLCMGHWHSLNFLLSYGIIVNGSLKGYDEYAMSQAFEYQRPEQAIWITSKKGNIWFTEAIKPEWSDVDSNNWIEIPGNGKR